MDQIEQESVLAEIRRMNAETGKLVREALKLEEEAAKMRAEAEKLRIDARWYPVIAAAAFLGGVLAIGKFLYGQ